MNKINKFLIFNIFIIICSLFTSCNKNVYKESSYSKELSEFSLTYDGPMNTGGDIEAGGEAGGRETFNPYISKLSKKYNENYESIYIINEFNTEDDYYTCAYIDKNFIEYVVYYYGRYFSNLYRWVGRKYLMGAYNMRFRNSSKENIEKYPIKWLEIPKSDEIPINIGSDTLMLVSKSYNISARHIDSNEVTYFKMFFQDPSSYKETWKYRSKVEYNIAIDNIDLSCPHLVFDFTNKPLYIECDYDLLLSRNGFKIENINNELYLNVRRKYERNIKDPYDLRSIFTYITKYYQYTENDYYLFKYDEVLSYIINGVDNNEN